MTRRVTITGEIDGAAVRLVLQAATVLSGMRRAILAERVSEQLAKIDMEKQIGAVATLLVGRFTYPDLIAAVVESEGMDVDSLSLDEFLNLPQEFVDNWLVAVYDLCPHWSPKQAAATVDAAEAEKKDAASSSSGSGSGS